MAVYLGEDRPTSSGPLDVSKNAGADNVGLLTHDADSSDNELLDPDNEHRTLADEEELLREKNPLGYTITPPTEAEIAGRS